MRIISIAEQVAGRRDRVQFEIVLNSDVLDATLGMLKKSIESYRE